MAKFYEKTLTIWQVNSGHALVLFKDAIAEFVEKNGEASALIEKLKQTEFYIDKSEPAESCLSVELSEKS